MTNKKNIIAIEDAEYGVDSRYMSVEERDSDATALMEARLIRMKKLTKEQIIRAKLLQLKMKMEEYINNPVYDKRNYFSEFLGTYVDIIYAKRSSFAKDIDVSPVSLSQIINNHREPKDDFILRLLIHSEMAFKNVCEFHKKIWYQVYFQEKICDTMSSQEKWRPEIEKHVSLSESINE